jgi:hypothetical protein
MAVPTVNTKIQPKNLLSGFSRYLKSTVIYWGANPRLTFTTYQRKPYTPSPSDTFGVIPPGSEYRPDKVSQNVYNTPDLWWKIMEVNGIYDIYDFKAGLTIRLPGNIF